MEEASDGAAYLHSALQEVTTAITTQQVGSRGLYMCTSSRSNDTSQARSARASATATSAAPAAGCMSALQAAAPSTVMLAAQADGCMSVSAVAAQMEATNRLEPAQPLVQASAGRFARQAGSERAAWSAMAHPAGLRRAAQEKPAPLRVLEQAPALTAVLKGIGWEGMGLAAAATVRVAEALAARGSAGKGWVAPGWAGVGWVEEGSGEAVSMEAVALEALAAAMLVASPAVAALPHAAALQVGKQEGGWSPAAGRLASALRLPTGVAAAVARDSTRCRRGWARRR